MNSIIKDRFFLQSLSFHLGVGVLIFLVIYFSKQAAAPPMVEFRVIEAPKKIKASNVMPLNAAPVAIPPKKKAPPKPKKKKGREVFGTNKKTLRSTNPDALKTKQGNTVAKEVDQKKLKKGDEEALPIPEEEYLVTAMPRVKSEFRAPYPTEAKEQGIEGKVVMEILVDEKGAVRKVTLISGLGYGMDEAAMESIKKFIFEPAKIGERAVAVVIRYGINFVLED